MIYRPQVAVDFCPQFGAFGKTGKLPSPKITKLLLLWCISTMNKIVIGWCIDLNSFFWYQLKCLTHSVRDVLAATAAVDLCPQFGALGTTRKRLGLEILQMIYFQDLTI